MSTGLPDALRSRDFFTRRRRVGEERRRVIMVSTADADACKTSGTTPTRRRRVRNGEFRFFYDKHSNTKPSLSARLFLRLRFAQRPMLNRAAAPYTGTQPYRRTSKASGVGHGGVRTRVPFGRPGAPDAVASKGRNLFCSMSTGIRL